MVGYSEQFMAGHVHSNVEVRVVRSMRVVEQSYSYCIRVRGKLETVLAKIRKLNCLSSNVKKAYSQEQMDYAQAFEIRLFAI